MLNIEGYKDDLKLIGTMFKVDKNTSEVSKCNPTKCHLCALWHNYTRKDCDKARIDWLLETYSKPTLTADEANFLKALDPRFKSIEKVGNFLLLYETNLKRNGELDLNKFNLKFNGIEPNRPYDLKDIIN